MKTAFCLTTVMLTFTETPMGIWKMPNCQTPVPELPQLVPGWLKRLKQQAISAPTLTKRGKMCLAELHLIDHYVHMPHSFQRIIQFGPR